MATKILEKTTEHKWTYWTATAISLGIPDEHELPTDKVIYYQFTNAEGRSFRIRLLDNGKLKINVDSQIVIYPGASNTVELEERDW